MIILVVEEKGFDMRWRWKTLHLGLFYDKTRIFLIKVYNSAVSRLKNEKNSLCKDFIQLAKKVAPLFLFPKTRDLGPDVAVGTLSGDTAL